MHCVWRREEKRREEKRREEKRREEKRREEKRREEKRREEKRREEKREEKLLLDCFPAKRRIKCDPNNQSWSSEFFSGLAEGTEPTSPFLGGSDCATEKMFPWTVPPRASHPKDSPISNIFYKGYSFLPRDGN
ncbi:hypothetical protein HGM15179_005091 [Zosterops borbonicus]|uniref:Uncharacterized protein n=1 Tax=Zosterops borbonicus TaxID=364589 RepID=A0A8K1LQD2_9PASS|nr:hypothetical protein HGM15179_005091 [Zosterops borbonicus]